MSFDNVEKIELQTLIDHIRNVYEKLPFNNVLGLNIETLSENEVIIGFKMREELIGNYVYGILHGGVVSSVLDVTGGLTATIGMLKNMKNLTAGEIEKRVSRVGTIDLRIDYLRPGKGDYFRAAGSLMRLGRKVAVTRMELYNDQKKLIGVGTGTYIVG